jgi:hypothetical protein
MSKWSERVKEICRGDEDMKVNWARLEQAGKNPPIYQNGRHAPNSNVDPQFICKYVFTDTRALFLFSYILLSLITFWMTIFGAGSSGVAPETFNTKPVYVHGL